MCPAISGRTSLIEQLLITFTRVYMDRRKLWQKVFDWLVPYRRYDSFFERTLGEHIRWGRTVIYGWNAMHVAINVETRWGYVCFHPTFRVFGVWWPWYFYISRDGTPSNCILRLHYENS